MPFKNTRKKIVLDCVEDLRIGDVITYNPGNPNKGKDRYGVIIDIDYDTLNTVTLYPFTFSTSPLLNQVRLLLIRLRIIMRLI
jgi:hypothetical protein